MSNLDHDMLDRALDAAEAKMAEDETNTTSESVPEASEASAEPAKEDVAETVATKEAIEKTEKAPIDKPAKLGRDASGKFVKGAKAAPQEQISTDQTASVETQETPITAQADLSPIEPPTFWSSEHKALFAKAPREVQTAITQYEAQRNDWASRVQRESERGKAIESKASEVFKPYELKLKANGIKDPFEAADRLLAWNEMFETNPKAAIADLMAKNGLTPQDFAPDAEVPPEDPRIVEIQRQAEEAKKAADEIRSQMEQERESVFKTQIENFKLGKDSQGNTRKPFAEMYAPQIDQAFQAIQRIQPMPLEQALNQAYEYVLGEARKQFGTTAPKPATAQKTPEAIIAQSKKQAAASGSVTGAPKNGASPTRPRAKTIDEALDRAEATLYGDR